MISYFGGLTRSGGLKTCPTSFTALLGGAVELPCTALKEENNVWVNMDL